MDPGSTYYSKIVEYFFIISPRVILRVPGASSRRHNLADDFLEARSDVFGVLHDFHEAWTGFSHFFLFGSLGLQFRIHMKYTSQIAARLIAGIARNQVIGRGGRSGILISLLLLFGPGLTKHSNQEAQHMSCSRHTKT